MKFYLFLPLCFFANLLIAQSQPFGVSLYFDKGSFVMSASNDLALQDAKKLIADSTYNAIFIKGYTDNDGSDEFNLDLSEKRVGAVVSYLDFYGFEVKTKWYGEKEAITKNKTEEEKSINRRVDVIFWTDYKWGNKNKKAQVFTFSPNSQIEFTAAEGTKIKIPANSIVYSDNGNVPYGDVQVAITEYYSMSDIIQNKLTTSSSGDILISAGMINIEASRNGKNLKLKEGTTMEVGFAERSQDDGFGIFYGTDQSDQVINWVPAVDTRNIKEDWYYSGVKLFESDTIERWRIKLDFNKLGQRTKVTETWVEGKELKYDTTIIDKTINKNNIILQSTRLGWINCDMFYTPEQDPENIVVEVNEMLEPELVLIFKDKKAMIKASKMSDGKYVFYGVPRGEKIIITGIGSDEGKLYFTKAEFESGKITLKLDFIEATIEEIDKGLSGYY